MADEDVEVNVTSGTARIGGDLISGVFYPRVKLDVGADGLLSPVHSANPLPVSVASLPLPTGAATAAKQPAIGTAGTPSSDVLSVQGISGGVAVAASTMLVTRSSVTVTGMTAGLYASGDQVGSVITFANCGVSNGKGGRINSMHVLEKTGTQKVGLELWLFHTSPTVAGDNNAHSISDADMANCVGVITTGNYYDTALNTLSVKSGVNQLYLTSGSTNLYGVLVTRSTPTYGSTTDLIVTLMLDRER